jgi:hypothetical protein
MRVFLFDQHLELFPDGDLELPHFLYRPFPIVNHLLRLDNLNVTAVLDLHLFAVVDLQGQPALDLPQDFGSESSDIDIDDEGGVHDCSAFSVADLADVLDLETSVVGNHEVDPRLILFRVQQKHYLVHSRTPVVRVGGRYRGLLASIVFGRTVHPLHFG